MKPFVVLTLIACLTQHIHQVASVEPKEAPLMSNEVIKPLNYVKVGIHLLKNELKGLKQEKDLLSPETFLGNNLSLMKNCNISNIQTNLFEFANNSINLVLDISDPMVDIMNKVNQCASNDFIKLLSCFLNLHKSCQQDISKINQAVATYGPKTKSLVKLISNAIINCFGQ